MADGKEPNRTVFVRGLPLDITTDKLLIYCGPAVQFNEKGKPTIHIFDRKDNQRTASAKVTFTHNAHAKTFIFAKNGKKFPNFETQLHIAWFGEKKVKGENKVKTQIADITPDQAVIVDGLPKSLNKRELHVYFQNEVGEVKTTTNSQPMIDILEKKADKQKVRVTFHSVVEARMCRLKLDGSFYNDNHDFTLRIVLEELEQKPTVVVENKQKKENKQRAPRNRQKNKSQPALSSEGTSVDGAAFYAVHVSNLPASVDIPSLFFFLSENVTGISRWDNWVPKIKILNRDNGKTCAMVTFDTDLELKEGIRKLNGLAYNNDAQFKLKVRQFFEKTKPEANNSVMPEVPVAALSLDDLPGPYNPDLEEKKEPSPRKEKPSTQKGPPSTTGQTLKKQNTNDNTPKRGPSNTAGQTSKPATTSDNAPRKGPPSHAGQSSKPPTAPDNAVSPLGCKVLIQGIPLSVIEETVINFITEPIIRTPQGTPLVTLFPLKPNARSVTPRNRQKNKSQPALSSEGTSVDGAAFYAVHVSNLPASVDIPSLFFFLSENVTGISRWDNWVPKIKILNRDNGKTCAMVTFDTDLELKEGIRKLNGLAYNNDAQFKLKVRQFFEKTKPEANNSVMPEVPVAALSLDDLPGPYNPDLEEKKEPSPRKEKPSTQKGPPSTTGQTLKKQNTNDNTPKRGPSNTAGQTSKPATTSDNAPRKGPPSHAGQSSKPPTAPDNAVSPLGCKVLIQGIPLSVIEETVINFITEPIIRTPQGTPLVTLFPLKPNARSRTALVHLIDMVSANLFIQQWNNRYFPLHAANKPMIIKLYQDRPSNAAKRNGDISLDEEARPQKQIVWNVVFVASLPKTVTPEQVKDVFKHCGEIRRINLFENDQKQKTGCGTVSFANMGSAERCINSMNNIIFPGFDKKMLVKFFEASTKRQGNQPGGSVKRGNGRTAGHGGARNGVQVKAFDCTVCFETCEENEMIGCVPIDKKDFDQDSHYICMECARLHAEALITDGEVGKGGAGLPCCTTGCARVILRAHVMKLLDNKTARLLDKRMTSVALLGIAGIEYCIRCDYGEFIEANTIQIQYFHCRNVVCGTSFCRICKVDSARHRGKRCEEADPNRARDRERKKYEEELSATVIRICPTCRTQFQKLDGCNKMVCQNCKTTMCYLCRETGINYDHFRYGSRCGQDADSTAYDQARLNEVRNKYTNTAGGSRTTAETSFYGTANPQRVPRPQAATETLYYGQAYRAAVPRPEPEPWIGQNDFYREYARRPAPQPVVEPKRNTGCTIC